jgi:N-hydroxyarylamine O-acetyltransferase
MTEVPMRQAEITARYLAALGLLTQEPTKGLLDEITRRHVATFAFSSVGPRLGDVLPLDAESLFDRIVVRRRGGYCFEQNGLLFAVLQDLGYDVRIQLARVILVQDNHPPLTHRVSLVDLDGERYVVDVGFGPLGPPIPVPLVGSAAVGYRISEGRPGELHMQALKGGDYASLYRFELVRYGQADCELGHFYSHRHPEATFVNNLVGSLILEDEVRSLRNREYWVMRPSGDVRREVTDADVLASVLREELGIRVTDDESRRLYAELPEPPSAR